MKELLTIWQVEIIKTLEQKASNKITSLNLKSKEFKLQISSLDSYKTFK
jgi:hypothetical protein